MSSSISASAFLKLSAEFQRTARRDKKDFLSDQCKEIEIRIEIEKIIEWERDLLKKTGDTQETFHGKMRSLGFPKKLLNSRLSWSIYIALCKCLK